MNHQKTINDSRDMSLHTCPLWCRGKKSRHTYPTFYFDIRWPQRLCQWVCACLHLHVFASRILLTQMNYFFELNFWPASSSFCSASLLRREDKPFAQSTDHAPAITASLCYRIYCLYIIAVSQLFWHVLTGFICSNIFKSTKNQRKSIKISFLMFSPELSSKLSHSSPCFLPFLGGPLNPRGTNGSGVLRWLHDMWQSCRDKATQRVVTSDGGNIYIYIIYIYITHTYIYIYIWS